MKFFTIMTGGKERATTTGLDHAGSTRASHGQLALHEGGMRQLRRATGRGHESVMSLAIMLTTHDITVSTSTAGTGGYRYPGTRYQ